MKKILNICILTLLLVSCYYFLCGCNNTGGISIVKPNTVINGTHFDTANLKIIEAEIVDEIDYSIKIIGKTTPLSDKDWLKWFGESDSDIAGKTAVALKLELTKDIALDKSATVTLPDGGNENSTKDYLLSDILDGDKNNPYCYIILNTKHDIAKITLTYTQNNKQKNIIYQIDMLNVNSDSERLE